MSGSSVILRWTILGSLIGFFGVGGLYGLAVYVFGGSAWGALAVALFTGLLGGPGFGGMMGFVTQYSKYNEKEID